MLTIGDAIERFLKALPPDLCPSHRHSYHATIAKHLPWAMFCRQPAVSYRPILVPEILPGMSAASAAYVASCWHRFERLLSRPGTGFLTLGDAVKAFLDAMREQGRAPKTIAQTHSALRAVVRHHVKSWPLTTLDLPLARDLWDHPWSSRVKTARVRRFLRFLQIERMVPYRLFETRPQRSRALERCLATPRPSAPLGPHSPIRTCVSHYLHHLKDTLNRTEDGLKLKFHHLRMFLDWCEGRFLDSIGDVTSEDVIHFLSYRQHERGNGPSTLRATVFALRSFFQFLVDEAILKTSPADGLVIKAVALRPPTAVVTAQQIQRVMAVPQRQLKILRHQRTTVWNRRRIWILARNVAMLELLSHTGIRAGELLGLKMSALDLRRGRILVTGKGSSRYHHRQRWIYIESPAVRYALEDYLAVRPDTRGPWLFISGSDTEGPLSRSHLARVIGRYAQQAGIKTPLSPHRFRVHFASSMIAGGMDPLALQALMGHQNIHTTLRHYVALDEKHLRDVWQATNPLAHLDIYAKDADHE